MNSKEEIQRMIDQIIWSLFLGKCDFAESKNFQSMIRKSTNILPQSFFFFQPRLLKASVEEQSFNLVFVKPDLDHKQPKCLHSKSKSISSSFHDWVQDKKYSGHSSTVPRKMLSRAFLVFFHLRRFAFFSLFVVPFHQWLTWLFELSAVSDNVRFGDWQLKKIWPFRSFLWGLC